jgi:hypothetical protein
MARGVDGVSDTDDHFWGSAGESPQATVKGVVVETDVAVNEDGEMRIAAWTADLGVDIEIVFAEADISKVRDLLETCVREGTWLA